MTCRSTRIDHAAKNTRAGNAGRTWMRIETTSHAERRRCQVAVWIQEENGSFRISVYCLSCLCWYLMVKNHTVLVFHHHYMNPLKSLFLCVSPSGFGHLTHFGCLFPPVFGGLGPHHLDFLDPLLSRSSHMSCMDVSCVSLRP